MSTWYIVIVIYIGIKAATLELPMVSQDACVHAAESNQFIRENNADKKNNRLKIVISCERRY
jgi:hypothetical protein